MAPRMLPPSIPGGQPRPPMPSPAPKKPGKGSRKPVGRYGQVGPKSKGGFGVTPPPQMGV